MGSEMCIRDSLLDQRVRLGDERQNQCLVGMKGTGEGAEESFLFRERLNRSPTASRECRMQLERRFRSGGRFRL